MSFLIMCERRLLYKSSYQLNLTNLYDKSRNCVLHLKEIRRTRAAGTALRTRLSVHPFFIFYR